MRAEPLSLEIAIPGDASGPEAACLDTVVWVFENLERLSQQAIGAAVDHAAQRGEDFEAQVGGQVEKVTEPTSWTLVGVSTESQVLSGSFVLELELDDDPLGLWLVGFDGDRVLGVERV